MSITNRQKEILFAIIEEYAEMAAPVGSFTLAKLFGVSSATIRAEMAKLEEAGYLSQHQKHEEHGERLLCVHKFPPFD